MTGFKLTPWRKQNRKTTSPTHLFDNLHDEVDRLFEEFASGSVWPRLARQNWEGETMPATDPSETDKFVEVSIDLPGIDEKDIDITLSDNVLTVKASRQSEAEDEAKDYHRIERTYGSFFRQIPMPCQVLEDDVQASFKKGVLTIALPKAPGAQNEQRKIEIRSA